MVGGLARSIGLFYVVSVGGGVLILAAVTLARSAYDALPDRSRRRACHR